MNVKKNVSLLLMNVVSVVVTVDQKETVIAKDTNLIVGVSAVEPVN